MHCGEFAATVERQKVVAPFVGLLRYVSLTVSRDLVGAHF